MVPERGMLAAVEHIAERLAACEKRQEAERLLELLGRMGDDAVAHLRNILTTRPAAEAVLSVAPLSRLDMVFLSQELPPRISAWGRAAQDALVRQLGVGGAVSRGSLLTLLLPVLDPLITDDGDDFVDGNQGNDTVFLGAGNVEGLRFCPHIYNSPGDIERTVGAIRELCG